MANKRLSSEQFEELQKMVVKGVYPDDIARYFGIAVSSIHNYKNKMRKMGLNFPSIKGKKPHNSLKPEEVIKNPVKQSENTISNGHNGHNGHEYKFIVNGVSITINSKVKSVNISDETFVIDF